ncbi:MAG: phage tail sheath subtilisin-like domain-containing protein [Gemmatimonadaceae bacterium]
MPANFLHGVETIEVVKGVRTIRGVKTAVIGIVGTAPIWAVAAADRKVNEPLLILNDIDAAKYFGPVESGYTIPQALKGIFDQGRGIAIVVNVFDPAVHKEAVVAADYVLDANDRATLLHKGALSVVVKDQAGAITYVIDVDYTIEDVAGVITVIRKVGGAILAGATLKINYDRPDVTDVVNADIIGTVNGAGDRTGMQAWLDSYNLFGFFPKLLLAPAFCTLDAIVAELVVKADKLRAIALVDAPIGTTRANAIAGRSAPGAINFETSSPRVILCYPHVLIDDGAGGSVLDPYSSRVAGVIAARDMELGYHWSPSNAEIKGIIGVERRLSAMINDPTSDVNALNEVGITTIFSSFGTGFRTWGNRSAAWPTDSSPKNLVNVRRTADILHESIEYAMLQFIDQPITDALLDAIKDSVNSFIRTLIGRGALIDGACTYDPAKNPPAEIALGHLVFDLTFMPPPPAERITFESFIDVNLLSALGAQG